MQTPTPSLFERWKAQVKTLKTETIALSLAIRDRRTPWYAKVFASLVVAYAFAPIDLVPDFIPILGYLDDLIIVPLGIALSIRMIPAPILDECRIKAETAIKEGKPTNWVTGMVIVLIWIGLAALLTRWFFGLFN
ncbi:MAG TPA: YkvA family protein [Anaerolineales bacterium]|nr:YkvA family protein [Anaerolineales bacterium]